MLTRPRMKNAIWMAVAAAIGASIAVCLEGNRRRCRHVERQQEKLEVSRWEDEGGAVPEPSQQAPAFGRM